VKEIKFILKMWLLSEPQFLLKRLPAYTWSVQHVRETLLYTHLVRKFFLTLELGNLLFCS